jgi:hypothetical protein
MNSKRDYDYSDYLCRYPKAGTSHNKANSYSWHS